LMQVLNESVYILTAPVAQFHAAAIFGKRRLIRERTPGKGPAGVRIEIIVQNHSGYRVTPQDISNDFYDKFPDGRFPRVKPERVRYATNAPGEFARDVIGRSGLCEVCSRAIGVYPRVNGYSLTVSFPYKVREWVVAGRPALGAGEETAPGLDRRWVECITFRPYLNHQRVQAPPSGSANNLAYLCLLRFQREATFGGEVEIVNGCDPSSLQCLCAS